MNPPSEIDEDAVEKHLEKIHARFVAKRKSDRVLSLGTIVSLLSIAVIVASCGTFLVSSSMMAERKNADIRMAIQSSDSNRIYLVRLDRRMGSLERNSNLQTIALCSLIKGEMKGVCSVLKNEMQVP